MGSRRDGGIWGCVKPGFDFSEVGLLSDHPSSICPLLSQGCAVWVTFPQAVAFRILVCTFSSNVPRGTREGLSRWELRLVAINQKEKSQSVPTPGACEFLFSP